MNLDAHQRLIFMEWCKSQSESCRAIAEQIDKTMAHAMGGTLSSRERSKAAAFAIVAMELASVREEYSVRREEFGVHFASDPPQETQDD